MLIGVDASRTTTTQRTGTEAYSLFLLREIARQSAAKGHEIRFYYNMRPREQLFSAADNVDHRVIPFPRMWTHLRLASELHRNAPDVFFTPAHVIPFSYSRPSVATVHDLGFVHFPEAHTRRQLTYLRWSTKHNANRAKLIIADSEASKADLRCYYGVDPARIEVVYPGVDPTLRPIADQQKLTAVTRKYGVIPPFMLYIGTIQPRKNLVRLIDCFLDSDVDYRLVIAGKAGWLSESIISHIDNLEGDERARICLPGYIAEEDKAALLSAAEAVVFPSLYEGFGFPLVEANACGTPVLSSDSSSLPEIAGDAALLVDPRDEQALQEGIRRIAVDTALRNRLVQAGIENGKRFSWETAAEKTLEVFERAAGR